MFENHNHVHVKQLLQVHLEDSNLHLNGLQLLHKTAFGKY